MEYEKLMYYANATQMSATTYAPTQSSYRNGEQECNRCTAQPTIDPFVTFADSFDLSLLPQDTAAADTNIPTTVYQYNESTSTNYNSTTTPTIKIEESWCKRDEHTQPKPTQTYSLLYEQLSRRQADNSKAVNCAIGNQLIPPPTAYPSLYPSPQSSPSQSEYHFSYTPNSSGYDSLSSSRASLYSTSPCPSLDAASIKQELHILPPSPPESNCEAHSPRSSCADIKCEPIESDVEGTLIDLNTLLESSEQRQLTASQLSDTNIQRKHNLKTLESFIDGLEADSEEFEPVISLALQHVKREADAVCAKLQISQDPTAWSTLQVHAWLRSTIEQFKLQHIENLESKFNENGADLILLSEEEFMRRAPECGSILHAQLEIWKMAYSDDYKCNTIATQSYENVGGDNIHASWAANTSVNAMPMDLDDGIDAEEHELPKQVEIANQTLNCIADNAAEADNALVNSQSTGGMKRACALTSTNALESTATATAAAAAAQPATANTPSPSLTPMPTPTPQRNSGSHIHLWQFLKELLQSPHINGTAIRWIDRSKGIFKIEDSVRVAKLWGKRKNRPAMNYDKLSRSIRQYYKKGIMKKTERSQRLVYQFCHPYYL